jgi:hypothetical protein
VSRVLGMEELLGRRGQKKWSSHTAVVLVSGALCMALCLYMELYERGSICCKVYIIDGPVIEHGTRTNTPVTMPIRLQEVFSTTAVYSTLAAAAYLHGPFIRYSPLTTTVPSSSSCFWFCASSDIARKGTRRLCSSADI